MVSTKNGLAQTVPNSLQQTGPSQVYTKARVKYPMVRKGYLANPSAPQGVRGSDEFVQVSWDEAYKLIHEQHMRIRKAYGPESIFAGSYGWRSSGVLHKAQTLLQRYMSMSGGYAGHLGDYSTGAAQVIMPHVVGSIEVYEQQTTYPVILENSKVVVLWGLNPINTLKIAWSSSDGQGLEFFHQLKKSGKTVIIIDPMRSETAEFFGDKAQWIAPNPQSDVAMMMGIAYQLIKTQQHDTELIVTIFSNWAYCRLCNRRVLVSHFSRKTVFTTTFTLSAITQCMVTTVATTVCALVHTINIGCRFYSRTISYSL